MTTLHFGSNQTDIQSGSRLIQKSKFKSQITFGLDFGLGRRLHCLSSLVLVAVFTTTTTTIIITTQWGIITGPPSFKQRNLVNIQFIYMRISDTIAEGMLSLDIWK